MNNATPRRPRGSSTIFAALVTAITVAAPLAAQRPDSAALNPDSVRARLERAEAAIRELQGQLAAQGESSLRTRSGVRGEFSGRVLMNGFSNSARTNNTDVPTFVRPDTASGLPAGGLGGAMRQTTLGAAVVVPSVFGAEFRGDIDVDFYGGQQPSSGGRTFPLIRLRTARGTLTWRHGELLFGQESPLTSGLNPLSLASVSTPGFTSAGNLWLWIPQLRGTLETAGRVRVGVQGAVLAPMSSDAAGLFDTDFDIAERSKRPTVQGRVRVRWGGDRAGGELGVGAHRGWFAAKGDSLIGGQMVSADARVHFTRFVELRGEAFDGKALRGLGGGGIGQSFGVNGVAVSTRGGWAQLNLIPSERVTVGFGSGVDDPTDVLVSTGGRLRNQASAGHLQLRPGGGIVLGAEWRRIWTRYASATRTNDHINVAVGFEW